MELPLTHSSGWCVFFHFEKHPVIFGSLFTRKPILIQVKYNFDFYLFNLHFHEHRMYFDRVFREQFSPDQLTRASDIWKNHFLSN